MANDIFDKGSIVHTIDIPEELRSGASFKKDWGAQVLADYVAQYFGDRARWTVTQSRSHNGSLTGTKIVIIDGDKQTIYMMVEPKHQERHDVHIAMVVNDLSGGGIMDVIDYKYSEEGEKVREPLDSPFAALAALLPKDEEASAVT